MPTSPIRSRLRPLRLVVLAVLCGLAGMLEALAVAQQQTPAAPAAAPALVPAYRQANQVAVLTVDGVIDSVTYTSLERRIRQAVADGADAIVLDINTPGGDLFATLDICSLLKDRSITPANTVAWIHPTAFSAGTIIALACREIVVSPNATLGDAAPIATGPLGMLQNLAPTERAKLLAPLQTEIIDSARRNHYDENLVRGFIELGWELWLIENIHTGERVVVDPSEYERVFGEAPPAQPVPQPPQVSGQGISPWVNKAVPRTSDTAGLDEEALRKQAERESALPPVRQPLTDADRGNWRLITRVNDGNSLLTLRADEAIFYGLAVRTIANDAELQTFFNAQQVVRYDTTWSESLVRFLVNPIVRAVLLIIFLVSLFIELAAPGLGIFGATALAALLLLIGAPYLAGMAEWWDILLIVVGLLLVVIELFLLPGMGIPGIIGVLCLLVGMVGTFITGDITTSGGQSQLWTGLATTLTAVFAAGVIIWFISRQLHSFPVLNQIILTTELKDSSDTARSSSGLLQAMGTVQPALEAGMTGIAETDLRPSGRANINGRMVDVSSVGPYIARGTPIRVVSVGRFVIEVEEASE